MKVRLNTIPIPGGDAGPTFLMRPHGAIPPY
jgi:hypothetical protein